MWRIPQKITDFVTFTEEILNGKLRFLCSVYLPIRVMEIKANDKIGSAWIWEIYRRKLMIWTIKVDRFIGRTEILTKLSLATHSCYVH